MTGFAYLFIYLFALILPGWLIVRLSGVNAARPLFILAGSYIYYALLAALSKGLHLPGSAFYLLYLAPLLIMLLLAYRLQPTGGRAIDSSAQWIGLACIIIGYGVYHVLTGPYTEVPGDFLRHLEFAKAELGAMEQGQLGRQRSLSQLLSQNGGIWYSYFALVTSLTGLELHQSLGWTVLGNSLVFLSAVYFFACYLFEHYSLTEKQRVIAALLATLFVTGHMGLNVFSYLRYYALAPTMLNMVVYFAAVVAVLELLRWQNSRWQYAGFLLGALLTTILVHHQEGLFILVMGGLMLAWFALFPRRMAALENIPIETGYIRTYRGILLLMVLGFLGMVTWAYLTQSRPELFHNKIIQLSQQGPILNRILLLNPAYQFSEVLTLWGGMVYLLWIIYWRRFIGHPFLFAGMLVPLFTVLNPLFVDWFLRMDGVHTLWRMLYIVPLHFVAALLLVFIYDSIRGAHFSWKTPFAYAAVFSLVVLLLPLGGNNSNSRLTLAPVDEDESYLYWKDLIDYLNQPQLKRKSVLTDPVTAYMIKGLTPHRTYHRKFFNSKRRPFNFDDYSNAPLERYRGWWLILNDRDGGFSETGQHSGHWPAEVLTTSGFYSAPLRRHILNNPNQRFRKIWEQDAIQIYEIQ